MADSTIQKIISDYTAEAGVRGLKRQLDTICRFAAVKLVGKEETPIIVNEDQLVDFLGRDALRHEHVLENEIPGIVTGLAWTKAGGGNGQES